MANIKRILNSSIIYGTIFFSLLVLVVLMQNCQSEISPMSKKSSASLKAGELGVAFANSSQSLTQGSAMLILEGICETGNYPATRIDWQFNIGSVITGRLDAACSGGRFFLNIPLAGYTIPAAPASFVLYATIYGISNNGAVAEGLEQSRSQVTINIVAAGGTGTGTAAGSGTGGTGTPTNACLTNPTLDTLCSSIQAPGDYSNVVQQLASEQPGLLASCARRQADNPNWNAFTKELVRRLRAQTGGDNRWGFNYVRGVSGDVNGDTISYCGGSGCPAENSPAGVIFDVIANCGGANPTPSWQSFASEAYTGCCTGQQKWTQTPLN